MKLINNKITLAVCMALSLSACSPNKTTEEYLSDAQVLLKQNKNSEAIINLKNVLKSDSKNAEARFLLGKSYMNQGKWLVAEK